MRSMRLFYVDKKTALVPKYVIHQERSKPLVLPPVSLHFAKLHHKHLPIPSFNPHDLVLIQAQYATMTALSPIHLLFLQRRNL